MSPASRDRSGLFFDSIFAEKLEPFPQGKFSPRSQHVSLAAIPHVVFQARAYVIGVAQVTGSRRDSITRRAVPGGARVRFPLIDIYC